MSGVSGVKTSGSPSNQGQTSPSVGRETSEGGEGADNNKPKKMVKVVKSESQLVSDVRILNNYGNATPPPMPSREKRPKKEFTKNDYEIEQLPLRKFPRPNRKQEPFERPATADPLREQSDVSLKQRVGSVDVLADSSPTVGGRRRKSGGQQLSQMTRGVANTTPSESALNLAQQPPKQTSINLLENPSQLGQMEDVVKHLPSKGLLKEVVNNDPGVHSPPLPVSIVQSWL